MVSRSLARAVPGQKPLRLAWTAAVAALLLASAACSAGGGTPSPSASGGVPAPSSPSTSASAPAPAAVTVARGAAHKSEGCSSSECSWVEVTTAGLTGSVTCTVHDDTEGQWDSGTFTAPLDRDHHWYYGYPGRSVWVVCAGIESNHVTW